MYGNQFDEWSKCRQFIWMQSGQFSIYKQEKNSPIYLSMWQNRRENKPEQYDRLSISPYIHVFISLFQVWLCRIPCDVYEKMIRDTGNGIHFGHIYITGCQRTNINTTNFDTFHLLCQLPYAAKSNSHFNLFGCMPKRFGCHHSIWKP